MTEQSTREQIREASQLASLNSAVFSIIDPVVAAPILNRIESHFVQKPGLRWWWEAFRIGPRKSVYFPEGNGFQYLTQIVPPDSGLIWFIAEEDITDSFVLCQGTVEAIRLIISECSAFEYYLVPPDFDWLVGENHHNTIFAIGETMVDRLSPKPGGSYPQIS